MIDITKAAFPSLDRNTAFYFSLLIFLIDCNFKI